MISYQHLENKQYLYISMDLLLIIKTKSEGHATKLCRRPFLYFFIIYAVFWGGNKHTEKVEAYAKNKTYTDIDLICSCFRNKGNKQTRNQNTYYRSDNRIKYFQSQVCNLHKPYKTGKSKYVSITLIIESITLHIR